MTKQITVLFSDEQYAIIEDAAKNANITKSDAIRAFIADYYIRNSIVIRCGTCCNLIVVSREYRAEWFCRNCNQTIASCILEK